MGGDVLHLLAHQPHAAPVSEALQILLSPTYRHVLTSRLISALLEHPAAVACTGPPQNTEGLAGVGCSFLGAPYSFRCRLSTLPTRPVSRGHTGRHCDCRHGAV